MAKDSKPSEAGFKEMSQRADDDLSGKRETHATGSLSDNLESVGVDTDKMVDVANESVSEFQRMLEDEIRARPLRAIVWAAAAGLVLGFMAAR